MQTLRAAPWQLWFLVLGAIWGCSFLFIKLGLESLTPIGVAFGRVTIGAIVLLVIARATGTRFPRDRATWRHLAVVGLLFCSIPFTLFAYGETQISSILAGIINACTPLAALLVVFAAFPEQRPGRDRAAGLAVGFAGRARRGWCLERARWRRAAGRARLRRARSCATGSPTRTRGATCPGSPRGRSPSPPPR